MIDIFVENGHKKAFLKSLVKDYHNAKKKNNDSRNYTNSKKISWVSNIGPKIRKEFKKVNKDITFTSSKNLKSILCQTEATNSRPGVYQLDGSCNGRYLGESKKKVLIRYTEHQQGSIKGTWESSVATEHTKERLGQFNWIYARKITVKPSMYKRKVREALEIDRLKILNETSRSLKVLNRDNGDCVAKKRWKPLFWKIGNH